MKRFLCILLSLLVVSVSLSACDSDSVETADTNSQSSQVSSVEEQSEPIPKYTLEEHKAIIAKAIELSYEETVTIGDRDLYEEWIEITCREFLDSYIYKTHPQAYAQYLSIITGKIRELTLEKINPKQYATEEEAFEYHTGKSAGDFSLPRIGELLVMDLNATGYSDAVALYADDLYTHKEIQCERLEYNLGTYVFWVEGVRKEIQLFPTPEMEKILQERWEYYNNNNEEELNLPTFIYK